MIGLLEWIREQLRRSLRNILGNLCRDAHRDPGIPRPPFLGQHPLLLGNGFGKKRGDGTLDTIQAPA